MKAFRYSSKKIRSVLKKLFSRFELTSEHAEAMNELMENMYDN